MIFARSILYFVVMSLSVVAYGLPLSTIGWLLPLARRQDMGRAWGRFNMHALRWICGLDYRITGAQHLATAPAIIMAKHQSTWETLSLRALIPGDQVWVLKQELLRVPVFGWALAAVRPIAIDRKAGMKSARQIIERGKERLAQGGVVIIFPEGTRTAPGEKGKYAPGGGMLAAASGCPVVPVAHNAGVYWRRRGVIKYPGTIEVVVGEPMDTTGLKASEINHRVEAWIEGELEKMPSSPVK